MGWYEAARTVRNLVEVEVSEVLASNIRSLARWLRLLLEAEVPAICNQILCRDSGPPPVLSSRGWALWDKYVD